MLTSRSRIRHFLFSTASDVVIPCLDTITTCLSVGKKWWLFPAKCDVLPSKCGYFWCKERNVYFSKSKKCLLLCKTEMFYFSRKQDMFTFVKERNVLFLKDQKVFYFSMNKKSCMWGCTQSSLHCIMLCFILLHILLHCIVSLVMLRFGD